VAEAFDNEEWPEVLGTIAGDDTILLICRSPRARSAVALAARWARQAEAVVEHDAAASASRTSGRPPLAILLASAYPANLARRRSSSGEEWLSAGGRGFRLDPLSPLAGAEWLAIGAAQGEARGARILAAIALDPADVEQWLGERIERRGRLAWNEAERRVDARLDRRLGAIVLASPPDASPDPHAVASLLLERSRQDTTSIVPRALLARAEYAGIAGLDTAVLGDTADEWLAPLLAGRRDLDLAAEQVTRALLDRLEWNERQRLDALAPRVWVSPAGTAHPVDYEALAGPTVELRVQALFGLDAHPTIGSPPQPLLLSLTSPAGRPLQTTADLPGFWRGSWREIAREMKGRYPRHRWPEEPWLELPSLKTRNALARSRGA
jgi:ATP-dependent helicase HrpB